jgi:adenylate cyclase
MFHKLTAWGVLGARGGGRQQEAQAMGSDGHLYRVHGAHGLPLCQHRREIASAAGAIRGFTAIAETTDGGAVIELLNEIFETLTASLRPCGGQVLKFMGDGMLATFALDGGDNARVCRDALDAAIEAMRGVERLNAKRCATGKPIADVDLALHVGEVLYGNVGAADRLDFTVIGSAVNEAARIETLCEPLGRKVLLSADLAAAVGDSHRLEPLGFHLLRGVREPVMVHALVL